MGTAAAQASLWGMRARDWAEVQEILYIPLFETVLRQTGVGSGTAVLDVGCGSCFYCQMAANRGAQVSGLDAADLLLDIARERVPQADFRSGEMENLPYADGTFDVVTGFNSFQFAANPVNALKEARRVLRPGGRLAIAIWGKPEETGPIPYFNALSSFLPPPPPGSPGPFALSMDGALEALVTQAGMLPGKIQVVDCPWNYPDENTLLRGLLSPAPAIRAVQQAGEAAVREAILKALAPFKTASGGYAIQNIARYMILVV
jgi:SAM-dependent methyltransferase